MTTSYPPPHPHHVPGFSTATAYQAAAAHPTAATHTQQAVTSQHAVSARHAAHARQSTLSRTVAAQQAISAQHNAAGTRTAPAARHGGTPQTRPGSPAPAPPDPRQSPFLTYPLPPRQPIYPTAPPWARPAPAPRPAGRPELTAPQRDTPARVPWHIAVARSLRGAFTREPAAVTRPGDNPDSARQGS